ncbi:MAG: hypothetical protein IPL49_08385 [Saprospirales bacterium]|nr:hypothetical protein [Saprospirales bacterium]
MQNLAASDRWLGIYGTPQEEANSFLTAEQISEYMTLLDSARTVAKDTPFEDHVFEATLPVQYAFLEQVKIRDETFVPVFDEEKGMKYRNPMAEGLLPLFVEGLKRTDHLHLHERGYDADQYAADYRRFLDEGRVWHVFLKGATFEGIPVVSLDLAQPPSPKYAAGDPLILIDGKRGDTDYHYNWLGFEGTDFEATLRLSEDWPSIELPAVRTVSVQFLQDQQSWVFFPEKVVIEISEDGEVFRAVHEESIDIVPDGEKAVRRVEATFDPTRVRAIRVRGVNQGVCPEWHSCVGNPCWIFVDEVVVGEEF